MDVLATQRAPLATALVAPVLPRLVRMMALVTLGLLTAAGLLICVRRASGALVQPLSPGVLIGMGVALAVLAIGFRRLFTAPLGQSLATYAVFAAPSVVLAIWVGAVTLQGSSSLGLVAFVGALLVEEGFSWGTLRGRIEAAPRTMREAAAPPRSPISPAPIEAPPESLETDATVSQNIVRRSDDGGETIEGFVRVDLAAGQRHAAAHLAICPPLARVPRCDAEQMDGPSAQIKVAQVLAYGVRFDVKLDEPSSEPTSVVVEFSIQENGEAE